MNHAITIELEFFMMSILWGSILLFVYDVLRIFRRLIKQGSIILAVEDLIFWVASSVFIFAMMYRENNGVIRGFSIMGMAIGMVLYHYILSEKLVNYVTKFIRMLFRPFAIVYGWIKKVIKFFYLRVNKLLNFILKRLKKWLSSVKMVLNVHRQASLVKRKQKLDKKAAEKKIRDERKLALKKVKEDQNPKKAARKKTKNELSPNFNLEQGRIPELRTNTGQRPNSNRIRTLEPIPKTVQMSKLEYMGTPKAMDKEALRENSDQNRRLGSSTKSKKG